MSAFCRCQQLSARAAGICYYCHFDAIQIVYGRQSFSLHYILVLLLYTGGATTSSMLPFARRGGGEGKEPGGCRGGGGVGGIGGR